MPESDSAVRHDTETDGREALRRALRTVLREWQVAPSLERIGRDRPPQASFGQQRLWFLERLMPGSATTTRRSPIACSDSYPSPPWSVRWARSCDVTKYCGRPCAGPTERSFSTSIRHRRSSSRSRTCGGSLGRSKRSGWRGRPNSRRLRRSTSITLPCCAQSCFAWRNGPLQEWVGCGCGAEECQDG